MYWNLLSVFVIVCECFFALNSFEDVESRNIHRSFVGWTGTELSFVQLSSSPRLRPLGRRPRESRLTGDTPLHLAAANGHVAAAELLLSKGATVDAKNDRGPGPQSDGKPGQKSCLSNLGHLNKFFWGFKFWEKLSAFSMFGKVVSLHPQKMLLVSGSMITM